MRKTERLLTMFRDVYGFDASTISAHSARSIVVQCSACKVVRIQGVPTHETGCSNAKHECKGCNTLVSKNQIYCEDCAV